MSVRLWDIKNFSSPLLRMEDRHKEFVQSIDWSPLIQNQVGSISWDQQLFIWNAVGAAPSPMPGMSQ